MQVTKVFLEEFMGNHPEWVIDELNLGKEELPSMTTKQVGGKYVLLGGKDLFGRLKEAWVEIVQHIDRFKTADLFLISTPMWNFSIPYMLKHYIDLIIQPKYLFRYTGQGTEGLVKGKSMVVIVSRGGQYFGDMGGFDFQEPYLRAIFGFIGIERIHFIKAEQMDMGLDVQKRNLQEAKTAALKLAKEIDA